MSQSVRGIGSEEGQSRHEIDNNSLFQNHNVQAVKAPEMQGSHSSDFNKPKQNTLISPARYEMALRAVVTRTLSLLDAEHCSIALIDKQTGELVTRASSRVFMTDSTRQSRFPLRHGIAGHVAATGQAFLCGDVRRTGQYLRIGNDEITSIMCAPIIHKKQVLGTITVTSPRYDAFTTDHLQLLEEMADQEAVGIAQLFHSDASLRQTEKLTSLLQLNQLAINATVRETLITKVIDWLAMSFEGSEVAVTLFGNRLSENAFFGSPLIAPIIFSRDLRKTQSLQFLPLEEANLIGQDYYSEINKRGLKSYGIAPLYRNKPGDIIGVIILFLPQSTELLGPGDEEILEEASDKLSEGIETAERFQRSQETRAQLSQLTQSIHDPIVKLNLAGEVSEWNDAAEMLFGYTATEIIGQFLPGDRRREEELFARVREGTTLANVLMEKHHRDGQVLSLSVTLAPIINSDGAVESISLLVKDITETTRLKQEAALRNQEMSNLSEIALRLASTLDNNNLLYLIHDHLSNLIQFDALYVASYDEVKQGFELQLHHEMGVYFAPEIWPATDPIMAWLLQHRRQLIIDSSDNDLPLERFRNMEGTLPTTLLITPTKLDDQVSGFIAIANYQEQTTIKQYHKQLMLILATQAAIAMEKARILRRSQLKTEQLTILRQVAKVTSNSLELNEVLINTIRELHRHIDFSWAYCQVFGADGLYRQLVKDYDKPDKEPEIQFGSLGLSLKEVSEQFTQALFVTDLDSKFPHHRRLLELYVDNKMRSGILTPLWYGERCIGILLLGTRQDYYFNDDELGLLSDIAAQANVAIENAQLHELVKIQVEQLALQTNREHKLLTETNHQKEQLEAIFGNSSDGLMQIDENRNVLRLNAAMASFVGANVTDTKQKCTEILRCQDKEGNLLCEIACPLQKVLELRQPLQHYEINLDNQAGIRRTVSGNWSLVTGGADGNNVVTTMRDVTALREVEQLKANFISMVSHELRNPINVINGFTKMLAEGRAGELNPLQQEFIGSVLVSVSQLKKLAEDILDLSRADAGRFGVNLTPISLKELILRTTNNIKPMIYAKNIRLITGQLPESSCMINADEMRLTQLIGNLFENAIKFTPQGGRIMIELKLLNEEVTVSIKDSGIGIAQEHLNHIFERFYQVQDEDTRRMRGTQLGSGLGLSICKEIVERHGGRIWVESTQGKGSTFSFTIPLTKN